MTASAPFRQADLTRAIRAAQRAGLPVARIIVRGDVAVVETLPPVEIGDSGEKPKATVDASLPEPRL